MPPDVLTNAELAQMVDTSDEWIVERTGIKERHILKGKGLGTSHMGAEAVRGLLKKTGTAPGDVDLLICATTTPDFVFPSSANLICDMVGIRGIGSFDVQAACSGFVYALTIAAQFIETGKFSKIVVVGADKMSAIIDYTDRATCVLFGDGAGAVLLEPNRQIRHHRYADLLPTAPACRICIKRPAAAACRRRPKPSPNACTTSIRKAPRSTNIAVARMAEVATELMKRNHLTGDMIDWLVPHQANKRIIEATAERMKLPPERVMMTIQKYGNTTAATIPLCLWDYEEQLKAGDRLILAAFGGGFTWGGAYLTWAYDAQLERTAPGRKPRQEGGRSYAAAQNAAIVPFPGEKTRARHDGLSQRQQEHSPPANCRRIARYA